MGQAERFQGGWWAFIFVFSPGTSSVTSSPEPAVMLGAAGVGATVGVPSPTAPGRWNSAQRPWGGTYRHSPTSVPT